MAVTGIVPVAGGKGRRARKQLAGQLFLTRADLPPLLVLMVAPSGRNGETVKELPAAHRLLDDKAVEVSVIKRRRGPAHWTGQAVWEIALPSRRLHTPGGLYLLVHRADRTRPADQRVSVAVVGLAQRPGQHAGHRRAPRPVHWPARQPGPAARVGTAPRPS